MLELKDVCFQIKKDRKRVYLLEDTSIRVPQNHFMAIVGPSGCGKTTLLKVVAGILAESSGNLYWSGRDLAEDGDFEPSEIGYVPQFSIAHDYLTVEESIENAIQLRVRIASKQELYDRADEVIEQVGLDSVRENLVKVLSGGQKRRLGLAMELVSNPLLLLCDEVTSGLDPKSERDIVRLLYRLSRDEDHKRIVVSVTHSLSNFDAYDSVLVLHGGRVVFHGPPHALDHYFSVDDAEEIYPRLAKRSPEEWHDSWRKHVDAYYEGLPPSMAEGGAAPREAEKDDEEFEYPDFDSKSTIILKRPDKPETEETIDDDEVEGRSRDPEEEDEGAGEEVEATPEDTRRHARLPGAMTQLMVLNARRWKIFLRDRTQLFLQIAILIGFPVLVVIFAMDGVGEIRRLSETINENPRLEAQEQFKFFEDQLRAGGLVSGLVMFQVVLLTLMGSNNSAREIAGERALFEKEKLSGLRPFAYLMSKAGYLSVLVAAQSIWMAVFVETFCQIPSAFDVHVLLLLLVNAAMTFICLGISSLMRSPDQASLMSVYLVGFQLPLSGAVLALPDRIEPFIRPFISAYWSWSGTIRTLEPGFLDAVKKVTSTTLSSPSLCAFVLLVHIVVGLAFAYIGAHRSRWD